MISNNLENDVAVVGISFHGYNLSDFLSIMSDHTLREDVHPRPVVEPEDERISSLNARASLSRALPGR